MRLATEDARRPFDLKNGPCYARCSYVSTMNISPLHDSSSNLFDAVTALPVYSFRNWRRF